MSISVQLPFFSDVSWRARAAVSSTQQHSSRKRANADSDQPAKRRKPAADELPKPISAATTTTTTKKATKKLTKKLGRSPTDAEIAAYIAKKERGKSPERASQSSINSPYTQAGGASAVAAAAAGEREAATWVDSVGEPPHKAMVSHCR